MRDCNNNPNSKKKKKKKMLSHPIADSGDDGVEVLDFAFQQHHPGTFSAVGDRMVEQHVEEVAELGRDAAVLQGVKISDGSHVGMTKQTKASGSHTEERRQQVNLCQPDCFLLNITHSIVWIKANFSMTPGCRPGFCHWLTEDFKVQNVCWGRWCQV